MDSFIDREVGETRLDSHGTFTVNSRLAIEKMAKFQLADKNYWMLKVIQAAVRSGTNGIVVSVGVESSRILFTPGEEWTLAQIAGDLVDPQPSPTPALYHFKQAIWSACFDQGFEFELRLPGASRELVFQDGQLEQRACTPGRQFRLTVLHRPATEMNRLIFEQAYACPVPLTVNQERVDDMASRDGCFFYEVLEQTDCPLKVTGCQPRFQFVGRPAPLEAGLPLVINQNPKGKLSQLHWVRDGIILHSQVLDIALNALRCDLYLSADGLQCDATGTRLVEDEAWKERRRQALQKMAACIQGLEMVRAEHKRPNLKTAKRVLGGFVAATLFFNPALAGSAALMGFGLIKAVESSAPAPTPESMAAGHLAALQDWVQRMKV